MENLSDNEHDFQKKYILYFLNSIDSEIFFGFLSISVTNC